MLFVHELWLIIAALTKDEKWHEVHTQGREKREREKSRARSRVWQVCQRVELQKKLVLSQCYERVLFTQQVSPDWLATLAEHQTAVRQEVIRVVKPQRG